jgi:hypothetical protein
LNSDKYKKLFRIFVTAALLISLIMNFTLLSKIDQLENEVNNVSQNQHHIISNVDSQTNQIHHALNEFKREQSWISTVIMDINTNNLKAGKAEAIFDWQVKELHNDSEVMFNYAYGESEDFKSIPAKELQKGIFQVNLPIEFELEPEWQVGVITSSNIQEESKIEEESAFNQNNLKYFVSVNYDDMVKSSEIYTEHLGHFGSNVYGFLQTDLHFHDDMMSVTLMNHRVHDSSNVLEEAYLLKYEGKSFIGEEELLFDEQLSPPDELLRHFQLDRVKQYENMNLILKVVYSNGDTFEKEVY